MNHVNPVKVMCTINLLRFTLGFALLLSFFATASAGAAQRDQRALPLVVNGDNNETAKAEMDRLAGRAEGKLIILVARLGTGSLRRVSLSDVFRPYVTT